MLSAVLNAGQSSPLYRELVLGGLASHVSASLLETEMMLVSPGLFIIECGAQHGVAAEKAEQAIEGVLHELLSGGIAPEELERARNQVLLSYYGGMRSNMSLARQVGGYTLACGDPLFGQRAMEALQAAGAEEVSSVLQRYLVSAPKVTVIQRPEKGGSPS